MDEIWSFTLGVVFTFIVTIMFVHTCTIDRLKTAEAYCDSIAIGEEKCKAAGIKDSKPNCKCVIIKEK